MSSLGATRSLTRRAGLVVAAAAALAAVTYASFAPTSRSSSSSTSLSEAVAMYSSRSGIPTSALGADAEEENKLTRSLSIVGITPATLAAAGVSAESVATVIGNAREHLAQNGAALWTAVDAHRDAVGDRAVKLRKVASGLATENEKSAATAACSAVTSACSTRDTALGNLYTAAVANLSSDQKSVLATLRSNRGREFDLKYLTASRTEEQWVALRDALANTRVAARTGEEADSACVSQVAQADAESGVAAAASNLSNSLAAVTSAWTTAVNQ